jgi:hypothetical protein
MLRRVVQVLPGVWLGVLLCLALLATPAGFALLSKADAGLLAGRLLMREAYLSLALGVLLLAVERVHARRAAVQGQGSQFSTGMVLALGTLLCTVVGYFVLQPMMVAARSGQGGWTFGQLHAASGVMYGIKVLLVAAMAWRATGASRSSGPG